MTNPDRALPPIEELARLARLRIEPAEAERLGAELRRILDHFESLQDVDSRGIDPDPYAVSLENVRRPDVPLEGSEGLVPLPRGARLVRDHAPACEGDMYRVPPILD